MAFTTRWLLKFENCSKWVKTPVIGACLYLEFYKRYGHQTYTNNRSWQKKKIYDVINIMTSQLMTSWRHNDVILLWRHNDVIITSSWWWRHKSSSFVKTYNWCKFQVNTISGTKDIEGLYFSVKYTKSRDKQNGAIFVDQFSRCITGENFRSIPYLVLEILKIKKND